MSIDWQKQWIQSDYADMVVDQTHLMNEVWLADSSDASILQYIQYVIWLTDTLDQI